MPSEVRIAHDLTLPIDAVTETFVILGKRGSGKTSTATVLTEELISAGQPVCVLDPKGDWWGLRSSADGQGPGLPVTIIGGEHADLPLPPESGAAVAEMVAAERLPVVLDMLLMSKTQQRTFVTEFMERLYRRNREPLHLVIDEADRFAPARADRDMARLLGAYEDIVLRGRKFGIGSTSITLRPAQLNSAIRSQVEVLIAMKMLGKLDVQAIDEWVRLHADEEEARELKASLPSLPVGTGWFWSPGWLEIMAKVHVRARRTFDSSATPRVGEQRIVPREFAPVNPADLERMAALLGPEETASGDAPGTGEMKRLRSELAAVRAELAAARSREPERVEVPVFSPGDIAALEQASASVRDIAGILELALSRASVPAYAQAAAAPKPSPRPTAAPRPPRESAKPPADGAPALGKAHRAFLAVLAQFPEGRSRSQLALLSGYSVKSSMMDKALSQLRSTGLVEPGQPLRATAAGVEALGGEYDQMPTSGPELLDAYMALLGKAERAFLQALLDAWPGSLAKAQIAEATGYSDKSSMLDKALSRLRTLHLISGSGEIRADETLVREVKKTVKRQRKAMGVTGV